MLVMVFVLPLHTVFLSQAISWKPFLVLLLAIAVFDLVAGWAVVRRVPDRQFRVAERHTVVLDDRFGESQPEMSIDPVVERGPAYAIEIVVELRQDGCLDPVRLAEQLVELLELR